MTAAQVQSQCCWCWCLVDAGSGRPRTAATCSGRRTMVSAHCAGWLEPLLLTTQHILVCLGFVRCGACRPQTNSATQQATPRHDSWPPQQMTAPQQLHDRMQRQALMRLWLPAGLPGFLGPVFCGPAGAACSAVSAAPGSNLPSSSSPTSPSCSSSNQASCKQ